MVESNYDAHYVTAIDVAIGVKEEDGKRLVTWWPQFRVIDTAVVTPDPEMADVVAKYEADLGRHLDTPIGITAIELDSRNTTVRSRETAIGASWPTPCAGRRRPRRRSPTAAASAAARSIRRARS